MTTAAGTSKYRAVRAKLLERIELLPVGDKLPSEVELCDEFGVSRITLRHAVDGLVQDGRLAREHGRGTFVTDPPAPVPYPEHFSDVVTGFHRQQTTAGNEVSTRVLQQELVPADAEVARRLGISVGGSVIKLARLRFVNGQVHQHVETFLPQERFVDVLTTDFSSRSLFAYLSDRYSVTLSRNELTVRIEAATAEIALSLNVEIAFRLLAVDSVVTDLDDVPVAFGTARHTPDNSEISLNLRTSHPTT